MSQVMRKNLIGSVERAICQERQDTYGNPEDSFRLIAQYWTVYLDRVIKPSEVADMMELLKIARRKGQKFHVDNYIDGAGYAILAGELANDELKKRKSISEIISEKCCCERVEG